MFPKSTVASITGIGAMAGGIGSMIIQYAAGQLFTFAEGKGAAFHFMGFEGKPAGYFIMFCFCGLAYLLAWILMKSYLRSLPLWPYLRAARRTIPPGAAAPMSLQAAWPNPPMW